MNDEWWMMMGKNTRVRRRCASPYTKHQTKQSRVYHPHSSFGSIKPWRWLNDRGCEAAEIPCICINIRTYKSIYEYLYTCQYLQVFFFRDYCFCCCFWFFLIRTYCCAFLLGLVKKKKKLLPPAKKKPPAPGCGLRVPGRVVSMVGVCDTIVVPKRPAANIRKQHCLYRYFFSWRVVWDGRRGGTTAVSFFS